MNAHDKNPMRLLVWLTPGEVKQVAVGVGEIMRSEGFPEVAAALDEVAGNAVKVVDLDQAYRSHSRIEGTAFAPPVDVGKLRITMIGTVGRLGRCLAVLSEDDTSKHRELADAMLALTRSRTAELADRRANEADVVAANLLTSLDDGTFAPLVRDEASVRGAIAKLRAAVAALSAARSVRKPVQAKEVTAARRALRALAEGAIHLLLGQTFKHPRVRERALDVLRAVAAESDAARQDRIETAKAAKAAKAIARAKDKAMQATIDAARKSAEAAAALADAQALAAAQAEAMAKAIEARAAAAALEAEAKAAAANEAEVAATEAEQEDIVGADVPAAVQAAVTTPETNGVATSPAVSGAVGGI